MAVFRGAFLSQPVLHSAAIQDFVDIAALPTTATEAFCPLVLNRVARPGLGRNFEAVKLGCNATVAPTRLPPAVHLKQPFLFSEIGFEDLRHERAVLDHQRVQFLARTKSARC